jgi:hypothetical protein
MPKNLYLATTGPATGKSALALGLMTFLEREVPTHRLPTRVLLSSEPFSVSITIRSPWSASPMHVPPS